MMLLRSTAIIKDAQSDKHGSKSGPVHGGSKGVGTETPRLRRTVRADLDAGAGGAEELSSSSGGTCPICVCPMSCSERLYAASCGYLCHLACMQRFSLKESQSQPASRLCPVCFSVHPRASFSSGVRRSVKAVVNQVEASRELLEGERRLSRSRPVSPRLVQDDRTFDNGGVYRGRQQTASSFSPTRSLELTSPAPSSDLMALLAARDVINKALETHYPGLSQPHSAQPCRDLPPRRTLQKAASAPAQSFHDTPRELGLARLGSYEENVFPGGMKFDAHGNVASPRADKNCSSRLFSPPPIGGQLAATMPGQGLRRAASLPLPPKTRPLSALVKEHGRVFGGDSEPKPRKQRHVSNDSDSGALPPVKETEEAVSGARFYESRLERSQSVVLVTERLADFYLMTAEQGGRTNRNCSGATESSSLAPLSLHRTKSM
ncbi:hypothetical protein KFL_007610030 [Klebsormidium nitens]|uniref:RING-type domain-containing protein n=1 Tax=Klebsormidium nitens TaxID=105231 RepID=A0A1Y1IKC1_KLENI|nr:hypothetical protein KFL_007610030 [Klebsormidium nitens]|eukprot:GAQ91300.1 hypothetical protein KFL_007610030 [Klebsormidium nitens]